MTTAQSNRERWPDIAKFVDSLRAEFGDVRVTCISEVGKGIVFGAPLPPPRRYELSVEAKLMWKKLYEDFEKNIGPLCDNREAWAQHVSDRWRG